MSWNYRVVRRVYDNIPGRIGEKEIVFAIHDAYYDNHFDRHPKSISVDPQSIIGTSYEELKSDLSKYIKAFEKPVLDYHDLTKEIPIISLENNKGNLNEHSSNDSNNIFRKILSRFFKKYRIPF